MTVLYDLIFLVFSLAYLPVFIFKRKMHAGFRMRLGALPSAARFRNPVWIHAVSVGEAMSVRHLVETLRQRLPGRQFVISTVTPTGNKIAQSIAVKGDVVIYLPLDLSWIARSVVERVDPCLVVLTETEIWPNFITHLSKKNIPIAVVNARISDRSLPGYLLARPLVKPLLNMIGVSCVQSEKDAARLSRLGMAPGKIMVTGNMKFDIKIKDYDELKKDYTDYRLKLGLGSKERLWIAASTHAGEEEIVLAAYRGLRAKEAGLKLIIAPRHPERTAAVEELVNRSPGLTAVRVSQAAKTGTVNPFQADTSGRQPVFILDTVGQLMYFYTLADAVFVGGSLVSSGGHNILEPASLGRPVVFGRHMFNFRDIAELFLAHAAAIQVAGQAQLQDAIESLVSDNRRAAALGKAGRDLIKANQGATMRNADLISGLLNRKNNGTIR
ncbi:MAG: 3-deoxy-D-manno-octulosonic acid transferase [Candidatus Omnitrophica bacterium]|nr:3-deoxy-D-manno-octulosonic acid transferase [Candidatus Omnitrophota bacterium]